MLAHPLVNLLKGVLFFHVNRVLHHARGDMLIGNLGILQGFVIFFLIAVVSRGGMGWGDVKLVALIGLATGFPLVLFAIVLAAVIGTIVAVVLMIARRRRFREALPFGPFLAVATMITLVWGSEVLAWYIGLMALP